MAQQNITTTSGTHDLKLNDLALKPRHGGMRDTTQRLAINDDAVMDLATHFAGLILARGIVGFAEEKFRSEITIGDTHLARKIGIAKEVIHTAATKKETDLYKCAEDVIKIINTSTYNTQHKKTCTHTPMKSSTCVVI